MPNPRLALLALAGMLGLALLTLGPPAGPSTTPAADPDDPPRPLDVASDDLPDPVDIGFGGVNRPVTRFRLAVSALTRRSGAGTLTLVTGPLTFNDYGDAAPAGVRASVTQVPVTLEVFEDSSLDGTLYQIRLPGPLPAPNLWLFLTPEPADEHRLLVWPPGRGPEPGAPKRQGRGGNPERVLALRPLVLPPDPLPPGKVGTQLSTLIRNPLPAPDGGRGEPNPQSVTVTRDPAAGGGLYLDPNYLGLGADGRVGLSTLLARGAIPVSFRPLGADPLARGRQAFELVPSDDAGRKLYGLLSARVGSPRTYVVVYAAEPHGPHRLVVKEGGAIRQVVTLTDYERENRLRPVRARLKLPPGERAAIDELTKACGSKFKFGVRGRHVWTVIVSGDAARLDPLLAGLPRLADLNYDPATVPPSGLPSLGRMAELTSVRIAGAVADGALESLTAAPQLTSVQVFASAGLTPRGLAPLARLPKVTTIQVSLPDTALEPPAADEVLRTLSAAPALEDLQVGNVRPSDAGLAHLRPLDRLRQLTLLDAGRITPAGLRHLDALPNLRHVALHRDALPPGAAVEFQARRPQVALWLPDKDRR